MNDNQYFEYLVYHYICNNPNLFPKIIDDFFKNEHLKKLFDITKKFYDSYKSILFNQNSPSPEQIREIATSDIKSIIIDPDASESDNLDSFMANAENIINVDWKKYDENWLRETVLAWINWKRTQHGYKLSIQYQKTTKITPQNVDDVINRSKQIIVDWSSNIIDDEASCDFYDPKNHIQTQPENLINTGYVFLNIALSGIKHGGFEPSTLTHFIGESRGGKCVNKDTIIRVRNKKTNKIHNLTIEKFYNMVKR